MYSHCSLTNSSQFDWLLIWFFLLSLTNVKCDKNKTTLPVRRAFQNKRLRRKRWDDKDNTHIKVQLQPLKNMTEPSRTPEHAKCQKGFCLVGPWTAHTSKTDLNCVLTKDDGRRRSGPSDRMSSCPHSSNFNQKTQKQLQQSSGGFILMWTWEETF